MAGQSVDAYFIRVVALWEQGKNTAEIAKIIGLPESVIFNSLPRARAFVRNRNRCSPNPNSSPSCPKG